MKIVKKLAKMAKGKGICEEWYNDLLLTGDKVKLIEMYLKGIDFCLSNDYPSNDFIREHFKGFMESYGLHLDEVFDNENCRYAVLLGNCKASIKATGYTICEAFVKHSSSVTIYADDRAFVMVDIFDDANVKVVARESAKVIINVYGGKITGIERRGGAMVRVKNKYKKTY